MYWLVHQYGSPSMMNMTTSFQVGQTPAVPDFQKTK